MRRNHSDAGGRTESSTELIARLTAEREASSSSAGTAPSSGTRSTETTGRRRRAATATVEDADTDVFDRVVEDVEVTGLVERIPGQRGEATTADRTAVVGVGIVKAAAGPKLSVDEATVATEVTGADDDASDATSDDGSDIVRDVPSLGRAARRKAARPAATRRLLPIAVGAAAMLVVTTLVTLVPQGEQDQVAAPELSGQVSTQEPPVPDYLPDYTPPTSAPLPTPEPPAATTEPPKPPPAPEPPPAPKAPVKDEGTQAAVLNGWKLVGGDEFNDGLSPMWGKYDGAGHSGNGRRTPDAVTVENGNLVIRGDSNGNTGGVAWKEGQRFGRWEMRAKFPKGDVQYHPVLILWPTAENWPVGGEIDFAETTSAAPDVNFFLHYGAANNQVDARRTIDITQWHNYAVEWVDNRITGFIDGQKWFESTDPNTMPPGLMHPTIQLDWFPEGGAPQPTEMMVDYMRVYEA